MSPWLKWIGVGVLRLLLKVPALVVVPFLDEEDRRDHPVWGVNDATDLSYWNVGVRNAVHNYTDRPTVDYHSSGDEDMEVSGLKVRSRVSKDGKYASYRRTWGEARMQGKKEFYIGWTMDSKVPRMRLTLQLRPF